jgi:hypothetical protein
MTEVNFRDAVVLAIVLGLMCGTMAFFITLFATGLDTDAFSDGVRVGAYCGGSVSITVFIFSCYRLWEIRTARRLAPPRPDEVLLLQRLLQPVEAYAAHLPWSSERPWLAQTHVRRERGTVCIDLHDLDLKVARMVTDEMIKGRAALGRIRIITGRGSRSSGGKPVIRGAVLEKLRAVQKELDWELILKAGSVTVRPLGRAPSRRVWVARFVVCVAPISITFAFSFSDLAGPGKEQTGMIVGVIFGVLLTALLASYRKRVLY